MVRAYTRRCNTIENIHEVLISDPHPRQLYGYMSLSDWQSKKNRIRIFIPTLHIFHSMNYFSR